MRRITFDEPDGVPETLGVSKFTGSIIPTTVDCDRQPPLWPYNPARAKQLLAEAGYAGGVDAGDDFGDAAYANLAEAVVNDLQTVGIRARLRPLERAAFSPTKM